MCHCATMQQIQVISLASTVSHGSGAHHLACGLEIFAKLSAISALCNRQLAIFHCLKYPVCWGQSRIFLGCNAVQDPCATLEFNPVQKSVSQTLLAAFKKRYSESLPTMPLINFSMHIKQFRSLDHPTAIANNRGPDCQKSN